MIINEKSNSDFKKKIQAKMISNFEVDRENSYYNIFLKL